MTQRKPRRRLGHATGCYKKHNAMEPCEDEGLDKITHEGNLITLDDMTRYKIREMERAEEDNPPYDPFSYD